MRMVTLIESPLAADTLDVSKCIICQKITPDNVTSTENGRKRIIEVAKVHNDTVAKQIKLRDDRSVFFYYISNSCHKKYNCIH